jgi:colanic acid/amylovoran biosynthesis protein
MGADEIVAMPFDLLRGPGFIRRFYPIHAVYALLSLAAAIGAAFVRPSSMVALRAYLDADLVISSGGAYLGGPRPGINLTTAFQIVLARILDRPCVIAPVTVKPMSAPVRFIVGRALRGSSVFGRDHGTVARLRRLGIPATFSGDLAFLSRATESDRPRHRAKESLCVAVAPRQFGWDTEPFARRAELEAATVGVLTSLVRERGARILVVAQSTAAGLEDDAAEITRLLSRLPSDVAPSVRRLPHARSVDEVIAQYAEADVVYAYRLHAAITALMAGTPSLVIDYEPKVRGVLSTVGLGDWVISSAEAADPVTVQERLVTLAARADPGEMRRSIERGQRLTSPFVSELQDLLGKAAASSSGSKA